MPDAAPRPCRHTGCGRLSTTGYCEQHAVDRTQGKWGDARRGSRQSRGYGAAWEALRKIILSRDKGLCQECRRQGKLRPARIVDHVKPKAEGGTDDEANLQSLCQSCSDSKTQAEAQRARGGGASNV